MNLFKVPEWDVGELVLEKANDKKRKGGSKRSGISKDPIRKSSIEKSKSKRSIPDHDNELKVTIKNVENTVSKPDTADNCTNLSRKDKQRLKPLIKSCARDSKRSKAEARLCGARFRYLNQKLYESSSIEAFRHFQQFPDDFARYHEGFREQTKSWPMNPVDIFIDKLRQMKRHGKYKVVDLGCGEAKIGQEFANSKEISVRSFDFVAVNKFVQVANMNDVPLANNSSDLVIFCLSLMNTDYTKAIEEAHRLLGLNGELWVAEVASRFGGPQGVDKFTKSLADLGFNVHKMDQSNTVFILFYAQRIGVKTSQSAMAVLKPCLYKRR